MVDKFYVLRHNPFSRKGQSALRDGSQAIAEAIFKELRRGSKGRLRVESMENSKATKYRLAAHLYPKSEAHCRALSEANESHRRVKRSRAT